MNLFINTVSSTGALLLFDNERQIVDKQEVALLGKESRLLIDTIDNFLTKNTLHYSDLENIVLVVGPGSFTGLRSVVLTVNTLAFAYENISLTPVTFFDIFIPSAFVPQAPSLTSREENKENYKYGAGNICSPGSKGSCPKDGGDKIIVKQSSKRDVFLSDSGEIKILPNAEFIEKYQGQEVSGDITSPEILEKVSINTIINYEKCISELSLQKQKKLEAFYVKKPSIT